MAMASGIHDVDELVEIEKAKLAKKESKNKG